MAYPDNSSNPYAPPSQGGSFGGPYSREPNPYAPPQGWDQAQGNGFPNPYAPPEPGNPWNHPWDLPTNPFAEPKPYTPSIDYKPPAVVEADGFSVGSVVNTMPILNNRDGDRLLEQMQNDYKRGLAEQRADAKDQQEKQRNTWERRYLLDDNNMPTGRFVYVVPDERRLAEVQARVNAEAAQGRRRERIAQEAARTGLKRWLWPLIG